MSICHRRYHHSYLSVAGIRVAMEWPPALGNRSVNTQPRHQTGRLRAVISLIVTTRSRRIIKLISRPCRDGILAHADVGTRPRAVAGTNFRQSNSSLTGIIENNVLAESRHKHAQKTYNIQPCHDIDSHTKALIEYQLARSHPVLYTATATDYHPSSVTSAIILVQDNTRVNVVIT